MNTLIIILWQINNTIHLGSYKTVQPIVLPTPKMHFAHIHFGKHNNKVVVFSIKLKVKQNMLLFPYDLCLSKYVIFARYSRLDWMSNFPASVSHYWLIHLSMWLAREQYGWDNCSGIDCMKYKEKLVLRLTSSKIGLLW